MIQPSILLCKLIRIRRSSAELYEERMRDFQPKQEVCPSCSTAGSCVRHDTYERTLIDFIYGKPVCHTLTVQRVCCRHCGRTHAVLPDVIIPYGQYSLLFLLRVLTEYFSHKRPVAQLCEAYEITPTMLYRWKALFLLHYAKWLRCLDAAAQPDCEGFLSALWQEESFADFFKKFKSRFSHSFLQNHAGRRHRS